MCYLTSSFYSAMPRRDLPIRTLLCLEESAPSRYVSGTVAIELRDLFPTVLNLASRSTPLTIVLDKPTASIILSSFMNIVCKRVPSSSLSVIFTLRVLDRSQSMDVYGIIDDNFLLIRMRCSLS